MISFCVFLSVCLLVWEQLWSDDLPNDTNDSYRCKYELNPGLLVDSPMP